jgi:O-antigen ligase
VFIIFLLMTPNLGVKRWMRYALIAAMLPLVTWAVNTAAFQERFFHEQGGDLTDLFTLSGNVDTSGRLDYWAGLTSTCNEASVTGLGVGATRLLSLAVSEGSASHPHNEILRLYCETGLIGSVLHWSFYVFVCRRAIALWRRTRYREGATKRVAVGVITLLVGFLLFSLTDNVLLYTLHYMAPLAIILGLSDRTMVARTNRGARRVRAHAAAMSSIVT